MSGDQEVQQDAEASPFSEVEAAEMDSLPGEAIPTIWSIYYRQGFDEGYRRAVRDVLGSLLAMSERFIDDQAGSALETRRVVYPFEEYLERQISGMTPDGGFVEGGMGI